MTVLQSRANIRKASSEISGHQIPSPKGSSHVIDEAKIEPSNHHFYSIFEVLEESLNCGIPSQCLVPNLVLTQHAHTIDQLFQACDTLLSQGSNTLQDPMIVLGSCATSHPATAVAHTSYMLPELFYFHAYFGDLCCRNYGEDSTDEDELKMKLQCFYEEKIKILISISVYRSYIATYVKIDGIFELELHLFRHNIFSFYFCTQGSIFHSQPTCF